MEYEIVDMHCDTIYELYQAAKSGKNCSLKQNQLHVDLMRMQQAGYLCQSFAIYSNLKQIQKEGISPYEYGMRLCKFWDEQISAYPELIRKACSWTELMENRKQGRMSALMTIEEGAVYAGSVENLRKFYEQGVRKSTLVWNYENDLAYPNRKKWIQEIQDTITVTDQIHGLKAAGRELVQEMERLGILIDLSHLNDAGILEVLHSVKGPVVASHSNARSVAYHARNLTDEMIREIAEHGGVIGINFYWAFLAQRAIWPYAEKDRTMLFQESMARLSPEGAASRMEDMLRHIRHIKNIGGIDVIGLGSDFDGISGSLEVDGAGAMPVLADYLEKNGFSESEVRKIMGENVLRVYKEVLG